MTDKTEVSELIEQVTAYCDDDLRPKLEHADYLEARSQIDLLADALEKLESDCDTWRNNWHTAAKGAEALQAYCDECQKIEHEIFMGLRPKPDSEVSETDKTEEIAELMIRAADASECARRAGLYETSLTIAKMVDTIDQLQDRNEEWEEEKGIEITELQARVDELCELLELLVGKYIANKGTEYQFIATISVGQDSGSEVYQLWQAAAEALKDDE